MIGEDRHEHGIGGHASERHKCRQQEQGAHREKIPGIGEAFAQFVERAGPVAAVLVGSHTHREKRDDYTDVTDAVECETPSLADDGDEHPRQGRTKKARRVHHGGIQGDGIGQIGTIRHHLYEKRLPARHIERIDQPLHETEQNDPRHARIPEGNDRQAERLQHRERLRDDQKFLAIPAIDPDAGEGSEGEHGNLSGKSGDAQEPGGVGETIKQTRRSPIA